MTYRYDHPHPAVTVDACVFSRRRGELQVLLVKRGQEPFLGLWALPGGFVGIDESLEDAVARELYEETGVSGVDLEQLHAFGAVDRDPRERVISIAYIGFMPDPPIDTQGGDDAAEARWFAISALPSLAFDHREILASALAELASAD